jgi:CBS domain-containing protein
MITVAEVMHRGARTCAPTDSLKEAAKIMWEEDCGAVPVVGTDGRLAGMVTDRDICMAAYLRDQPLAECTVADVMATAPIVTRPGEPVDKAEAAMSDHRIRRLPVVSADGQITGILSLNDLALAARRSADRQKEKGLTSAAIVATLAAISEHRTHRASDTRQT